MPISTFSLAVVGADHPNRRGPTRRFSIAICAPGDPVDLIPEPLNPADRRAIKVVNSAGVQIGYVTAERAAWVGGMLRSGREVAAIFQERTRWGAVIRVALDGEQPVLPAIAAPKLGESPGFWPDDIPPDD